MGELWFIGAGLYGRAGPLEPCDGDPALLLGGVRRGSTRASSRPVHAARLAREIGLLGGRVLSRTELEGERAVLDVLATSERVALLVPGDPFAATTHLSLRESALDAGHTWRYLPNASVATAAAGFLGLMSYRFGRIASLPLPEPRFAPTSPLETIRTNRSAGLHTLLLLDLRPSERKFLLASDALRILAERDPSGEILSLDAEVAVVARLGSETARGWFGVRRDLELAEFGPPLHAVADPPPSSISKNAPPSNGSATARPPSRPARSASPTR